MINSMLDCMSCDQPTLAGQNISSSSCNRPKALCTPLLQCGAMTSVKAYTYACESMQGRVVACALNSLKIIYSLLDSGFKDGSHCLHKLCKLMQICLSLLHTTDMSGIAKGHALCLQQQKTVAQAHTRSWPSRCSWLLKSILCQTNHLQMRRADTHDPQLLHHCCHARVGDL